VARCRLPLSNRDSNTTVASSGLLGQYQGCGSRAGFSAAWRLPSICALPTSSLRVRRSAAVRPSLSNTTCPLHTQHPTPTTTLRSSWHSKHLVVPRWAGRSRGRSMREGILVCGTETETWACAWLLQSQSSLRSSPLPRMGCCHRFRRSSGAAEAEMFRWSRPLPSRESRE
jgi:hypothetical protein